MTSNTTAGNVCPPPMKSTSNGVFQGDHPLDYALPLAILQICLVLVVTRGLAYLLKPLRQPRVIAEIVGGILLGPSAFGRNKSYLHAVFPPKSLPVLDTLANLGLIFFLFLAGIELDPKSLRKTGGRVLAIAMVGISLPFALGIGSSFVLKETIAKDVNTSAFLVYMGVALSITAFPVLARILAELKLLTTSVGRMAMSAAAVNDVAAWILLALAVALSGNSQSPLVSLWVFLAGCGFVVCSILIVLPIFKWMAQQCHEGEPVDANPNLPIPVLTKDILINPSHNTSARIFLPRTALEHTSKLPLIVYFHGGGFILFSAASDFLHNYCSNLANDVNSIVVSIDYRLSPEHRLPAAYDDAIEALHWIKTQPDDWLRNYADYSNCYIMGSSAGANIAYHTCLRVAAETNLNHEYLKAIKIRGFILSQPFFGGTNRVASESRLLNDPVLPPHVCDLMWELALPVGVDRDHEYCNPTVGDCVGVLDRVRKLGWRVLVSGCEGDPLIDHQMALARVMEDKGVVVVRSFTAGGCHGAEVRDLIKQKQLNDLIKDFILS